MLNYFDWNLCLPTACYFAMSLLPYAILETDRLVSGPILHPGKAHAYLEEYVSYFLRVSVSEMGFLDKLPSVVGVSVVAAARHVMLNIYFKIICWFWVQFKTIRRSDSERISIYLCITLTFRKAFGLLETWPYRLEGVSGYSWAELQPVVTRLLAILRQLVSSSQDEGYGSCSGSPVPGSYSCSPVPGSQVRRCQCMKLSSVILNVCPRKPFIWTFNWSWPNLILVIVYLYNVYFVKLHFLQF